MGINNKFINYHKHDHYSNIIVPDCTIKPIDYIKRALDLGHTAVSCVQHGSTAGFFEYYDLCKQNNLKFIYGVEAYFSFSENKEDKTNAHLIILAKNKLGFKIINKLLSKANANNFYYKARISLDYLLELTDNEASNIIITTACVGGIWKYDFYEDIILTIYNKFKNNFFLEVQYHNTESQKDINSKILELNKNYKIPLIMGCDSHMIYENQKKERDAFLYSKNIVYEDEAGWYLDYPSYDVCVDRFKQQGILSDDDIFIAIENTNICNNFEDIEFDKNIKIPSIYPNKTEDEKVIILKDIIKNELKNKFGNLKNVPQNYREAINNEIKVIIDTKMSDYFILNYNIIKLGKEKGGKLTLTSRGSCPSWTINMLLGFTTIDRLNSPVTMYPERFATVDRILAGSLFDIDMNIANREPFIEAQKELLGEDNSYWFSTYGTLKVKSAFKMYAKASDIEFELANNIIKYIDEYERALKYAEEDEKENIIADTFIPKEYINIFNESKKYQGIIDSISPHPCAWILLNQNISEELGIIKVKDCFCANIEGKQADKYMYMKNDLLAVTVVDIIYKTFDKIGIEPLNTTELMEIIKNNAKVWEIYEKGYCVGLNQVEQPNTKDKVMKYKPKNISELTAFVAGIRPSFKSMLDKLLNRENFSYNIPEFDNLLKTEELPQSFILYQEQIMKVLQYAGFAISESYTILKAIAKKKQGVVEPLKERFMNGFINNGNKIEEAEIVWKIIQDSSNYSFNASHALSVALDSVYGAYLKAYYPLEFYTTMIEIYTEKRNKDKLSAIKQEMILQGIKEGELCFGLDNSCINFNKENNTIYSSLNSIKTVNKTVGSVLYNLYKNKEYTNFYDLLKDIKNNTSLKSNQIYALIVIDYFKKFGKTKKLIDFIEYYDLLYNKKQIKKEKVNEFLMSCIKEYKETNCNYTELKYDDILIEIWNKLPDEEIDTNLKIQEQFEYQGYLTLEIPKDTYIFSVDLVSSKNEWCRCISLRNNKEQWFKFLKKPKKGSIIKTTKSGIYNKSGSGYKKNVLWIAEYEVIKK